MKTPIEKTPNGGESPLQNGSNGRKPPLTAESNGRNAKGRFVKGNRGGPGNPITRRRARFRALLLESVSDYDFKAIVARLVQQAKEYGDLAWVRELLDRTTGKVTPADTVVVDD